MIRRWLDINNKAINLIYSLYSPVYDLIFKKLFSQGHKVSIQLMNPKPEDKVLEVGIGTGLTLPYYPPNIKLYGIDICKNMLKKAEKKANELGMKNVILKQMDATKLEFEDATFDCVFAAHTIAVVPDPYATLKEMKRVCKPGGKIVLVNHFKSSFKPVAFVEECLNGICKYLGFETDIELEKLMEEVQLKIENQVNVNFWRLYKAVLCYNYC